MLESILYFGAGYILASLLRRHRKKADILLYWSADCLGWRPISHLNKIVDSDLRYLAAYEIEPPILIDESGTIMHDGSG